MTLIEIMVVIAIMAVVLGVGIVSMSGVLGLQQTGATKELAQTYRFLSNEAALKNVTFRIAYNLDARSYKIEVAAPDALVFTDPEKREEYEELMQEKMSDLQGLENFEDMNLSDDELELLEGSRRFEGMDDAALNTEVTLPRGSYFAWVYTPQYPEPVEPQMDFSDPDYDPDGEALETPRIVYSYIFANGHVEHTLVRIAAIDDPQDGLTIEAEPLSGRVEMHDEDFGVEDSMSWLPDEGPDLDI
ncbi:MAG: type II secretory pathway pseudopilin PulG [Cognaticolwellia sp.]|jgi:type II secretory pathway pseudopilin PulG